MVLPTAGIFPVLRNPCVLTGFVCIATNLYNNRCMIPSIVLLRCNKVQWDLNRQDLFHNFLASLPRPSYGMSKTLMRNGKGGLTEQWTMHYERVGYNMDTYFHGTHPGAVHGILRDGFRSSHDHAVHEFSIPGLYTTTQLEASCCLLICLALLCVHVLFCKFSHEFILSGCTCTICGRCAVRTGVDTC